VDLDILIQKYITNKATQEEKDILLDHCLKTLNSIKIELINFKRGVQNNNQHI